ncbi:MAG: hypothetical protein ACYC3L_10175 [Gemmatimonadaceae bacterium]
MRLLLLCGLVLLIHSPLAAQRSRRGCPEVVVDSAASGLPVYQACQVEREAKPSGMAPRLDWNPPLSDLRDGGCFRAEFQFVVDTLGVPEVGTIRDVNANNANFEQAVKDVIPRLRYEPARLRGSAVRQVVSYHQTVGVRRVVTSSPYAPPPSSRMPLC